MLNQAKKRLLSPTVQLTRKLCTLSSLFPTPPTPSPTKEKNLTKSQAESSLFRSLAAINQNKNGGRIDEVLNEWISNEGKSCNKNDIVRSVYRLCSFKKFDHALQLLEWTEKRGLIVLTCREHAKSIDLIRKARGWEAAEKYFLDLPESAKKKSTYGALLQCYCCEKLTDKAMALFEKMQALNFPINTYDYCSLMNLRINLGEPEKVPLLEQEMKAKGIEPHVFVYKLLINAYSSLKDIKQVERVEEEVKIRSGFTPDWGFYSCLAAVYMEAGLVEKAELNLKEIEKQMRFDHRAYHSLLNMYAKLGKAEEVDRIWESLKSAFPRTTNLSYLTRLHALLRLEDMDEIKRCYEEWESSFTHYDVRLANVLIKSYIKQDMIEEAKAGLDQILEKGYEPNFVTYAQFVDYFMENNEKDLARKYLELGTPHVRSHEQVVYEKVKERVLSIVGK
ncbi:hypothetical protein ACHQM5_026263 [Ranunculus cassubicifolius]